MENKILKAIKDFAKRFVMIYGYTMLATLFFLEMSSRYVTVGKDFFENMVLFSFIAGLPAFVFVSKHELNDKELIIRQIACIILEIILLVPLGHHFGLWKGIDGGILFGLITVLITIQVRFSFYSKDAKMANELVNRLKEIQKEDE